jgi:hypothetical protein
VQFKHVTLLKTLLPEQTESKTFQIFFHDCPLYSLFAFVYVRSFSLANFEVHNDLPQQKRALSFTQ